MLLGALSTIGKINMGFKLEGIKMNSGQFKIKETPASLVFCPTAPPVFPAPTPPTPVFCPTSTHHLFSPSLTFWFQLGQKDLCAYKETLVHNLQKPKAGSVPINMKWGLIWNLYKIYCLIYIKSIQLPSTYFQLAGKIKHELAWLFLGAKLNVCMNCSVAVNISRHRQVDAIGKTRTNS